MRLINGNFPDEVWGRLKAWAKVQAHGSGCPTIDECASYVEHIAKEITGCAGSLPGDVVRFYAAETAEMIAVLRERFRAAAEDEPASI